MNEKDIKFKKARLAMVVGVVFVLFAGSLGRLYYLQVVDYKRYADYSKGQYYQRVQINQTRGKIYDRNFTPMAITVPVKSAFVHPDSVEDKSAAARAIAEALVMDEQVAYNRVNSDANFVWIRRQLNDGEYKALKAADIKGLSFITEDKRFYPHKTMAGRLIGFCGIDNQGLAGLEYHYDKLLSGEKAVFIAKKDALGRVYGYTDGRDPNDRRELVTTIDAQIQYAAEKAVKFAFDKYNARRAVALVMATDTGEILAMAEQPEFNPNRFGSFDMSRYKSISVTESFEPGSVFKVFVAAAALDAGVTDPDEKFDCENGKLEIADEVITEAQGHQYGILSLADIIRKSSNIGAIKVARKLGQRKLYNYIKRMGFGHRTEVDVAGESPGIFKHHNEWSELSLPSISFGQEISATPIQLVTALSIIGNGGMEVKPHLFKEVIRNGKVVEKYRNGSPRRIISKKAAEQTMEMMRYAVSDGTGQNAYVKGFEMAGKTGTAQKYDHKMGRYSDKKHVGSFMGLFPAADPVVSILVMVDEPSGDGWGGVVAAPIVKEIAMTTARMLGIPANDKTRYVVDWKRVERKYLGKRPGEADRSVEQAQQLNRLPFGGGA